MNRLALFASVLSAGALLSTWQTANAQQVLDINFNSDTAGNAPATSAMISPLPLTKPYGIGGYDYDPDPNNGLYESPPTAADGTILVSGATLNTTWTTNSGDNQVGSLWMDTEYSVTSSFLQLKFDLNVLGASQSSGQSYTLLSNASTVSPVFGVNTFESTFTNSLRFNAVPTSSTGGVYGIRTSAGIEPFFSYTNGDNHQIELDADYSTGTLNVLVDGVTKMSSYAFSTPNPSATIQETFFYLNGDTSASPGSNSIALDNISASVPEPASLGLISLCAVGLLRRRRR